MGVITQDIQSIVFIKPFQVADNSSFSVTDKDFQEMSVFTQYADSLYDVSMEYFRIARPNIGKIGGGFRSDSRKRAYELCDELNRNVVDIKQCSNNYRDLCRSISKLCCDIDNFSKWYIDSTKSVIEILDSISQSGCKYGKVTDAFKKFGIDITPVLDFFERGAEKGEKLTANAVLIENNFNKFNDFFNNELPQKLERIAPEYQQLNNILCNDTFIRLLASVQNEFNRIIAMYHLSKIATEGLPRPAVKHMVEFVGHIGVHYNDIQVKMISSKGAFLDAENSKYIYPLSAALKNSAEILLASEKTSEAFNRIASKYIFLWR